MSRKLSQWEEVVTADMVPAGEMPDLLAALLEYLKLEIVRAETPDYVVYSIRQTEE